MTDGRPSEPAEDRRQGSPDAWPGQRQEERRGDVWRQRYRDAKEAMFEVASLVAPGLTHDGTVGQTKRLVQRYVTDTQATIATLTAERDRLVADNASLVEAAEGHLLSYVVDATDWREKPPPYWQCDSCGAYDRQHEATCRLGTALDANGAAGVALNAELAALRRVRDAARGYVLPGEGTWSDNYDRRMALADALAALPEGGER